MPGPVLERSRTESTELGTATDKQQSFAVRFRVPGWIVPLGLAGLALGIYAPVLRGGYFIDDWELLLANPRQNILGAFLKLHPYSFYRPLQLSLVAIAQNLVGPSTLPIHLVQVAILVALALLVAKACRELGASRWGELAGALWVVCAQIAAAGIGGIDTISQTLGTLSGVAACWCLYAAARRGQRPVPWVPLVLFGVALLSKETSVAYLPLLTVLAYRAETAHERGSRRLGVAMAMSFVILGAVYWIWRLRLGGSIPTLGAGTYDMRLGANLLVHPIMLWFSALLPVSTVRVFTNIATHGWFWPLAGVLGVSLMLAILILGLKRAGKLQWGLWWGAAATSTLATVVPLTHVSELYAFLLVPFIGVAIGLATDSLLKASMNRVSLRWLAVFVPLILAANAVETRIKAASMEENGRVAGSLTAQLVSRFQEVPPNGEVVLVDAPKSIPDYSVFRVGGFKLVDDGTILRLSRRPDISIRRAASVGDSVASGYAARGSVVVTLDPGRTRVINFVPGSSSKTPTAP